MRAAHRLLLPAVLAFFTGLTTASAADDAAVAAALGGMLGDLDKTGAALRQGDTAAARAAYHEFDEGWEKTEDDVRDRSRDAYKKIEDAMDQVVLTLVKADQPDRAMANAALSALGAEVRAFVATLKAPVAGGQSLPRSGGPVLPLVAAGAGLAGLGWLLRGRRSFLGITLAVVALALPGAAWADEAAALAAGMNDLSVRLSVVQQEIDAGDTSAALQAYAEFDEGWERIEDGVRPRSRQAYRSIEDGMLDVKAALVASPLDRARATAAVGELDRRIKAFVASLGVPAAPTVPAPSVVPPAQPTTAPAPRPAAAAAPAPPALAVVPTPPVTAAPTTPAPAPTAPAISAVELPVATDVAGLVAHLDRAGRAAGTGDAAGARAAVEAFRRDWPDVEGDVKARSAPVYGRTEDRMAQAAGLLSSTPPRLIEVGEVLAAMRADLAPIAETPAHYGPFDVAIILLREGLEALLVIGALLAFLRKTNNADKGVWVWGGGGLGVLSSVAVAAVINLLFARAVGADRELIEGVTGLVAAALLVYVSYWLHSRASLGAWQRYIHENTSAAIARGSLASLGLVAFLAVFREGAETALFYLGMAPSVTSSDLLLGLALGAGALVVVGVLMLVFGLRLPIRTFFLVSSALIYYLAFKFVGTGIHALQIAGVVSVHSAPYLPSSGIAGVFPTWETTVAQALLLMVALLAVVVIRLRERGRAMAASTAGGSA